jgi:hypothetical protein
MRSQPTEASTCLMCVNAMWRHRDRGAVSAMELAQSRAACRQTTMRQDRNPAPFAFGNPAYHSGGIGLETTSPPGGFG